MWSELLFYTKALNLAENLGLLMHMRPKQKLIIQHFGKQVNTLSSDR